MNCDQHRPGKRDQSVLEEFKRGGSSLGVPVRQKTDHFDGKRDSWFRGKKDLEAYGAITAASPRQSPKKLLNETYYIKTREWRSGVI